jgi:hypothetical protein
MEREQAEIKSRIAFYAICMNLYLGHACTVFAWRAAHVAYWCSSPTAHSCQASKSAAAGWATSGHGAASALSRDAFVGGFDCGVEVAHPHRIRHAISR